MRVFAVSPRRCVAEVIDLPAPTVSSPTGVESRMLEVGICGADPEISRCEYGTPSSGDDYLVLGLELLAEAASMEAA